MASLKQMKLTFYTPKTQKNVSENANQSAPQTDDGNETENGPKSDSQRKDNTISPHLQKQLPTNKPAGKQNFRDKWVNTYPWRKYDKEEQVMTCKICKDRGRKNAFTWVLTFQNLKYGSPPEDHQTALAAPRLEHDMKKAKQNAHSDRDKGVIVAHDCTRRHTFLPPKALPWWNSGHSSSSEGEWNQSDK